MDFSQYFHLILHADQHLDTIIAHFGVLAYIVLFAIVFCEIGIPPLFFLPGDPLLFICGAICATGTLSLWILMPLLFAAALLGSALSYGIGRKLGQEIFNRDYRWLDKTALEKTRAFYESRGGYTLIASPFIAVIRTFAPLVGGVSGMHFGRFLGCTAAGALLWVGLLLPSGYFFGNIPVIHNHLNAIVLIGVGLGVGSLVLGSLWKIYKNSRRPS